MAAQCAAATWCFGLFLHGGVVLVATLFLAWWRATQNTSRTWFEFALDCSKQIVAAAWVGVVDMACAAALASHARPRGDCAGFAAGRVADATLGVLLQWLLLDSALSLSRRAGSKSFADRIATGVYWRGAGSRMKFSPESYIGQLTLWLAVVTVAKVAVSVLLWLAPGTASVADLLLSGFDTSRRVEVFVVMVCLPLVMTSAQFLITDTFLRRPPHTQYDTQQYIEPANVDFYGEDDAFVTPSVAGCFLCGTRAPQAYCGSRCASGPDVYETQYQISKDARVGLAVPVESWSAGSRKPPR